MIQKHTTWPSSSTRFISGHVENRLRICWWHYKYPHTPIQWFPNRVLWYSWVLFTILRGAASWDVFQIHH